jgi:hypothetical protein
VSSSEDEEESQINAERAGDPTTTGGAGLVKPVRFSAEALEKAAADKAPLGVARVGSGMALTATRVLAMPVQLYRLLRVELAERELERRVHWSLSTPAATPHAHPHCVLPLVKYVPYYILLDRLRAVLSRHAPLEEGALLDACDPRPLAAPLRPLPALPGMLTPAERAIRPPTVPKPRPCRVCAAAAATHRLERAVALPVCL